RSIKDRLLSDDVTETDAATIMELCRLENRFGPAIDKLSIDAASVFPGLSRPRLPEQDWYGAIHFIELVDCTEDARKQLHGVFAPTVPRLGEIVKPQNGSPMRVVGVEYEICPQDKDKGLSHNYLIPTVLLQAIEND
ncbi:MAG: hypothetical protein KDA89_15035, partial [Planctomycetaceae bacterium]|nr:hypothetical protein [Planctomycetaceae bacterium]